MHMWDDPPIQKVSDVHETMMPKPSQNILKLHPSMCLVESVKQDLSLACSVHPFLRNIKQTCPVGPL